MNPILEAAQDLQLFLEEHELSFCFIGGITVLRWGIPRITHDVDVSLFVRHDTEHQIVASVLDRFDARISGAHEFAIENRVILAASKSGVAYDIALAQFEFERQIIERASSFDFSDSIRLKTISAEDLVVMKAFAGRDQDWLDVAGIVKTRPLDRELILQQLSLLHEVQPENDAMIRLNELFKASPP